MIFILIMLVLVLIVLILFKIIQKEKYKKFETEVLKELGFKNWDIISYYDEYVPVKSRQALEKYDKSKFFKENREKLDLAENVIKRKNDVETTLKNFLAKNDNKINFQYRKIVKKLIKF